MRQQLECHLGDQTTWLSGRSHDSIAARVETVSRERDVQCPLFDTKEQTRATCPLSVEETC